MSRRGSRFGAATSRRGQLVLLTAVAVAIALLALLTAYLQFGAVAGADRSPAATTGVDDAVRNGQRALVAATHEAADLPPYRWGERDALVTDLRDRLRPDLRTVEGSQAGRGVVYRVEFNRTLADRYARTACPAGPGREFGPCASDRGVVVQERAGRATVVAVAFDLAVTTERGHVETTLVVSPVRGRVER